MDTGGIPSNNEVIERCASERVALEFPYGSNFAVSIPFIDVTPQALPMGVPRHVADLVKHMTIYG